MKVLRDNTKTPWKTPWKQSVTCQHCNSTLELEASDLTFVSDQRDGDAYTYVCPCCKEKNWLDKRVLLPFVGSTMAPFRARAPDGGGRKVTKPKRVRKPRVCPECGGHGQTYEVRHGRLLGSSIKPCSRGCKRPTCGE